MRVKVAAWIPDVDATSWQISHFTHGDIELRLLVDGVLPPDGSVRGLGRGVTRGRARAGGS
jgi:hypothetical protein